MPNSASGGSDRPKRWWFLAAIALMALLLAVTAIAIYREWQYRISHSRAEAIFELVQHRSVPRATATPGATAWLKLNLLRYAELVGGQDVAQLYGQVAHWRGNTTPVAFDSVTQALAVTGGKASTAPVQYVAATAVESARADPPLAALQFRTQGYLHHQDQWLVVTRPKTVAAPWQQQAEAPSNRFLHAAAPRLVAISTALAQNLAHQPLPALSGKQPPRTARVYALSADSTLLTLPIATAGEQKTAALHEGREFRKLPAQPNFVANEFHFRFDFSQSEPQWNYSGWYLDLGGSGLVATMTRPAIVELDGFTGVLGVDLSFTIDWQDFAARVASPLIAGVVRLPPAETERWQPWRAFDQAEAIQLDAALDHIIGRLAATEQAQNSSTDAAVVHHGDVEGLGAVAAFQVAQATWLLILFPDTAAPIAWIPLLLLLLLAAALLIASELNRRRAQQAQAKAEFELQEKQNLLNTMRIPLVVTDPNSDEVVFSNQAARTLGIVAGSSIGDLAADDDARAHYQTMQKAARRRRRAYGLPLTVLDDSGRPERRYAVIRSVDVTAPIEALQADQRHRLGVLLLLDPERDLALLTADLSDRVQISERRKLAGILNHGVDTYAHLLARLLQQGNIQAALVQWLGDYVERRLYVTAWLLDHWNSQAPLPQDHCIERGHVEATLQRFQQIFAVAADDHDLRSRLHWDNGMLSAEAGAALEVNIDWPAQFWFAVPVHGSFGFFLGEVLINAIRHGQAGTQASISLRIDRARRELSFEVRNRIAEAALGEDKIPDNGYSGHRILTRLAHVLNWSDLRFERQGVNYVSGWRIAVSERSTEGPD